MALPDPLSFKPGPSGTESKCEPAIITFSGSPPILRSAITL